MAVPQWTSDVFDHLLAAIARQDEDAMSKLYDLTSSRVFGLAMRILGDTQAAEEATLDVYEYVWRKASSFDSTRGSVWTWLLTITRGRALDCARKLATREVDRSTREREVDTDFVVAPRPDPSVADDVRSALARLPLEQRESIELTYFEGFSYREAARRLDVPEGTFKSRVRNGMMQLRSTLARGYEDILS